MSLQREFRRLAALALLTSGAAALWLQLSYSHDARQTHRQGVDRIARTLANQIGHYAEQQTRALERLANQQQIGAFVRAGRTDLLRQETRKFAEWLPPGTNISVFAPDRTLLVSGSDDPPSFADMDMVRRTAKPDDNYLPRMSVHSYNRPDVHLAVARRLPGDGGVVLLSLPLSQITEIVYSSPLHEGLMELRQDTLSVAQAGEPRHAARAALGEIEIPNTAWKLVYYAPPPGGTGLLWPPVLLMIGTFVGIGYDTRRRLQRLVDEDERTVTKLIEDVAQGTLKGSYPTQIIGLRTVLGRVAQMQHPAERLIQPPPAPEPLVALEHRKQPGAAAPGDIEPLYQLLTSPETGDRNIIMAQPSALHASIFRAYDIRGIVGESLTPGVLFQLGQAIGTEALELDQQKVIVARDGRLSSPELSAALIAGLGKSGCDVVDIGMVPTPVLYFATNYLDSKTGVMITGSHNPPNYNGLKIVLGGETLSGEKIQKLRQRIEQGALRSGEGQVEARDLTTAYIRRIANDIHLKRPLKAVVDCGNGAAGRIAPQLLRTIGCDVVELFCEVDGRFPNHHPDPSRPENLSDLIARVASEKADLGIAFDGDGDRLGVVDSAGTVIWPDRLMMLFTADVLSRMPEATILYDIKCSRHLGTEILRHGGRALMWKTGHSLIKKKMKETGAQLAGEMSGHIFFRERWYGFDDGLYAACRLLEILAEDYRFSHKVFEELPDSINTPELNVQLAEGETFSFIERLLQVAQPPPDAAVTDIDGLRVDYPDGFGLVRASNTTPSLVLRFEADTPEALQRIQDQFRSWMQQVRPGIALPF